MDDVSVKGLICVAHESESEATELLFSHFLFVTRREQKSVEAWSLS
jgi:hypothetical protein